MDRRPSADMMAGMAEQFMTDWTSEIFRERCRLQIDQTRQKTNPQKSSSDDVERWLAENDAEHLEQFVFDKSKSREDYVSLIAEMMMMLRQHAGHPAVDTDVLKNANPELLASAGVTSNGLDSVNKGGAGAGK